LTLRKGDRVVVERDPDSHDPTVYAVPLGFVRVEQRPLTTLRVEHPAYDSFRLVLLLAELDQAFRLQVAEPSRPPDAVQTGAGRSTPAKHSGPLEWVRVLGGFAVLGMLVLLAVLAFGILLYLVWGRSSAWSSRQEAWAVPGYQGTVGLTFGEGSVEGKWAGTLDLRLEDPAGGPGISSSVTQAQDWGNELREEVAAPVAVLPLQVPPDAKVGSDWQGTLSGHVVVADALGYAFRNTERDVSVPVVLHIAEAQDISVRAFPSSLAGAMATAAVALGSLLAIILWIAGLKWTFLLATGSCDAAEAGVLAFLRRQRARLRRAPAGRGP
jgi:hypothetical protein